MPTPERTLIEQARHQPQAFRELYRAYFPRIYAYVAYRVGRKTDAEDITADVFTRVVESLAQFEYRGEGSFAAWLFRVAYNRVSQFYREQHRANEPISLDDLPQIHSSDSLPEHTLALKEQFAHLHAQIATLSARRQEIVTLKFFGGLRNQEIAAVLNLDERTVASHLSRALEDLQRKYQLEKEDAP